MKFSLIPTYIFCIWLVKSKYRRNALLYDFYNARNYHKY